MRPPAVAANVARPSAGHVPKCGWSLAASTPVSTKRAPLERSNSPTMSRKVRAKATIPTGATCWSTLSRLVDVRNVSLVKVSTRKRTTTQTTIMYSRSSSSVLETEASGLRATARCRGAARSSDTAEHRPHDRLLVRLLAGVLAHDPSCPHRDDPMREAQDLAQLAGDEHHTQTVRGQAVDEVVDGALGPHVDAARRLVGEQQLRRAAQPLGQRRLLLVAARERRDRQRLRARARVDALEGVAHHPLLATALQHAAARDGADVGHGDVLVQRPDHDEALVLAALREQRHAAPDARPRRARGQRPPVELDHSV